MPNFNIKLPKVSALLIALLFGLTACTPASDSVSADHINSSEDKVKVDERMTTDITPSSSFTTNSYDNIKLGDTFNPQLLTQNTDDLDGCFGAQSANHPDAYYMIIDNTVVEIGTSSEKIASTFGVKVGDSLEQLYAKHDGQSPEIEDSPYGTPKENIIVYYWHDQSVNDETLGTKYQVDNEVVTSISIGLESALRLWEGCA